MRPIGLACLRLCVHLAPGLSPGKPRAIPGTHERVQLRGDNHNNRCDVLLGNRIYTMPPDLDLEPVSSFGKFRHGSRLTRPYDNDVPSKRFQRRMVSLITYTIFLDLCGPKVFITLR